MPASATTAASIAFAADLAAWEGRFAHVNEALRIEADTTNATLRAAMIAAGIASNDAGIVALDAATAHIAKATENLGNVRWVKDLINVHAPAIDAAADQLVAVP